MKNIRPYLAVTFACVVFGLSFLFTKNILNHGVGMFQLLGYRFLVAAVVLSILALIGVIKIRLKLRHLKTLLLVALIEPVMYFLFETIGISLTSASESGMVIALVPIATTVFSVLLLKERLTWFNWAAVGVSVAGVLLIVLAKGYEGGSHIVGMVTLLGAVLAAGLYNPVSKRATEHSSPVEITFVMMWVAAIAFNGIGVVSAAAGGTLGSYFAGLMQPGVALDICFLGIVSSVGAFFCFNYALSKLKASVIGTFINLVPIVTVVAGVAFAGEQILALQVAGAALVLAGIWGTSRKGAMPAAVALEPAAEPELPVADGGEAL